jgi:hypothetical protein
MHEPATGYRGPAKHAHSTTWWLTVGWWWEPLAWAGRVALWLVFWPVGLWRSLRRGRKQREARERRGYRT